MIRSSICRTSIICLLFFAGTITPLVAAATVPYPEVPQWISTEAVYFGTGCALGDINGDSWLDMAVANGNDMNQDPNVAYYSAGGVLPTIATWVSTDLEFSGHCDLADLNGDGLLELAVAGYIDPDWEPTHQSVYLNGAGGLETAPSWQATGLTHSFRMVFGDADADGDMDLAAATGEAYRHVSLQNLVFVNDAGALDPLPGWQSTNFDSAYDARFVDIDRDGDLDLAFLSGGSDGHVTIHYSEDGVLATTPGWTSTRADNGNTFDFGDIDGDGWLDLAVGYNNQLSGSGRFAVYYSDAGQLPGDPDWESGDSGYGSAVALADVDADGDADLVTGRWWGGVTIYSNYGGAFADTTDWQGTLALDTVVEALMFADLDGHAEEVHTATFAAAGRLYDLGRRHLQGVDEVVVDGTTVPRDQWCFSRVDGWVSVGVDAAETVAITYRSSHRLDLAVSNWDGSTHIYSQDALSSIVEVPAVGILATHSAYPNPFNPLTTIGFALTGETRVRLEVFDLRGRRLATLVDRILAPGTHGFDWDARHQASGAYLYRLQAGETTVTGKLQLVK